MLCGTCSSAVLWCRLWRLTQLLKATTSAPELQVQESEKNKGPQQNYGPLRYQNLLVKKITVCLSISSNAHAL